MRRGEAAAREHSRGSGDAPKERSALALRITYSDGAVHEITVPAGQTILDATEANGLPIVSSCQSGVCGTCVARCTTGRVELRSSIGLSQAEKEAGRILACQARPLTDCEIAIDYPFEGNSARVVTGVAHVVAVERLGRSVMLIRLDTSALAGILDFQPGQFAQVRVPATEEWRSYSFVQRVANSEIEFLIRLLPTGAMSTYLRDKCRPGDEIELRGPKGSFTLRDSIRPAVLIAGGTGLSAILPIAAGMVRSGRGAAVRMYYGVTDADDLVLTDRLDALAREGPDFAWQGTASQPSESGVSTQGLVTDLLDPVHFNGGEADVYVCGPGPMVEAVRAWLDEQHLHVPNLFYEAFVPSGEIALRSDPVSVPAVKPATLAREGEGTAIVVGGSIAGIAAAKVLSRRFGRVIVLEKDPVHRRMEGRQGAAQGWHLHHLLIAGQQEIERIFPGIIGEMVNAGAFKVDMGEQYRIFLAGSWKKPTRTGIDIICAARPLLEWCLRRRLDAEPGIEYRYASTLRDLVIDPATNTVVAAVVESGGEEVVIGCEFLVDAAGKSTPLPELLKKHGFDPPEAELDDINCFYSTMFHRVPPERTWKDQVMAITYPYRPHQRYYSAQYYTDSSRKILSTTLVGYDCYDPPRSAAEFREYAKRMPSQQIGEELDGLEPVSGVHNFRYPTMQRFHYRDLVRYPGAVVAIGDSLASADPVSGAGMTKAFLEVAVLRDMLDRPDLSEAAAALDYYRRAGAIGDQVWAMIREQTMRYPWVRDVKAKRTALAPLQNWYVDRLTEAAHVSPDLYRTFLAVTHLVVPQSSLMRPSVVARVIGHWLWTLLRFRTPMIQATFGRYRPRSDAVHD